MSFHVKQGEARRWDCQVRLEEEDRVGEEGWVDIELALEDSVYVQAVGTGLLMW